MAQAAAVSKIRLGGSHVAALCAVLHAIPIRLSDTCWMGINMPSCNGGDVVFVWNLETSIEEAVQRQLSFSLSTVTGMAEYPEPNSMPASSAEEKSTIDTNIDDEKQLGVFRKVTQFLLQWGIETHG